MNFDHILKFAGVLVLIALLSYLGPLGHVGSMAIILAGLWKLAE